MKFLKILVLFTFVLSFLSCHKVENDTAIAGHPIARLIGKWVPYEISSGEDVAVGPFSYNSIFGAYNDSFEVVDTSGVYFPAVYYLDSLGVETFDISTGKKGELNIDSTTNTISFFEENTYWVEGQLEFKSDTDVWITRNTVIGQQVIKIKKF